MDPSSPDFSSADLPLSLDLAQQEIRELRAQLAAAEAQRQATEARLEKKHYDLDLWRSGRSDLRHLVMAAEFKDHDTGAHLVRIGYFASVLAPACGCDREISQLMLMAAPMHDIGKIGIPDHILKKAGALTPDERAVMERHTVLGAHILAGGASPLLRMAADIALTHHEHFDGSGYPKGLRAEEIPLAGRIVSVLDVFDALAMERAYRDAVPVDMALEVLAQGRRRLFDPDVVDAFFGVKDDILAMRDRINNGQNPDGLAEILGDDSSHPLEFYDLPLRASP
jgi:putative two-component system response regulator